MARGKWDTTTDLPANARILSDVVEEIRQGAPVVLLTGAGVSRESEIPLAGEVVGLLQGAGLIPLSVTDYPTAIETAFRGDAKARGAFIRSICHGRSAGPANQIIGKLAQEYGVGTLLTTNFDHLLEQSCLSAGSRPVATSLMGSPSGGTLGRESHAVRILKLHGDAHFDQTAHSEAEMSRHHRWLEAWAQLSIGPSATLLVLGQAGGDGPLQSLLLELVGSGKIAIVVWTMFSDAVAPPHLQAWAEHVREAGGQVSFVGPVSAESCLSEIYRGLAGVEPVISRLLLPGHQMCTGLVQGAGQIDRESLAADASPDIVRRLRRIIPANSRVAIRTDHKTETVFRGAAALLHADKPSFIFAFDQGDNLPVSIAFAKSLVAFVAGCTGEVFEPMEAHLAVKALASTEATLLVSLASPMVDDFALDLIDRIGRALPADCVLWVLLDQYCEKVKGFKEVQFSQPAVLLPSGSSGLLSGIRIALEHRDLETALLHEGWMRVVDDLVSVGLVFRRGGHVVVDHSRWGASRFQMPGPLTAALEEIGAEKDAIARLTVLGELENVHYQASRVESASRSAELRQKAAAALLECAHWWSGPIGSAYFIRTILELAGSDDLFDELEAAQVSQLIRILDQWPPDHRLEWMGAPVRLWIPGLYGLKKQLDRLVLGAEAGLTAHSPDGEILDQMERLERRWPGGSWLLPGWLLSKSSKATSEGLSRYRSLIRLAEQVNADCVLRDIHLDDMALLTTASDLSAAIELWDEISHALCERGGIVASIHARHFSLALLAVRDLEYAGALIYEATVHAARNGDIGRAWLCVKELFDVADSGQLNTEDATKIKAWARDWLTAIGVERPEQDTTIRLEEAIARRGLSVETIRFSTEAR